MIVPSLFPSSNTDIFQPSLAKVERAPYAGCLETRDQMSFRTLS